jgi:hypothetical protein
MMRVRFLRFAALEELRAQIRQNLPSCRTGIFAHLAVDGAHWFEHGIDINEGAFNNLHPSKGLDHFEPQNSSILYTAMLAVSPYEARDERLWSYLTRTNLLDYTRQRWPIPLDDDEAVVHIQTHFFARDKRQIERDNAASRLWWMAHLCARVATIELENGLQALLFKSDVRANIVERPTSAQSSELFGAILTRLVVSFAGKQSLFERETFRRFMREINSVGGFKLLDCLSITQIDVILDGILVEQLQLVEL